MLPKADLRPESVLGQWLIQDNSLLLIKRHDGKQTEYCVIGVVEKEKDGNEIIRAR